MATHNQGPPGSRIRPIEIALENLRMRVQDSFNSQLSNLKRKIDYIGSRLTSATNKGPNALADGADLKGIIEEIRSFVRKDMLSDTSMVVTEKLSELQGLLSQTEHVLAEIGSTQTQSTLQLRETAQIQPGNVTEKLDALSIGKDNEIASLREEINRLYNLTEREPRFQSFWILRDAYPGWLQITKMARTLGTTPGDVRENLKTFERLGLVEIKKGEARATKLVRPNRPLVER